MVQIYLFLQSITNGLWVGLSAGVQKDDGAQSERAPALAA